MMRDALAPLSEHHLQAFRCEIVSSVRLSPNLGGFAAANPTPQMSLALHPDFVRSDERLS